MGPAAQPAQWKLAAFTACCPAQIHKPYSRRWMLSPAWWCLLCPGEDANPSPRGLGEVIPTDLLRFAPISRAPGSVLSKLFCGSRPTSAWDWISPQAPPCLPFAASLCSVVFGNHSAGGMPPTLGECGRNLLIYRVAESSSG